MNKEKNREFDKKKCVFKKEHYLLHTGVYKANAPR